MSHDGGDHVHFIDKEPGPSPLVAELSVGTLIHPHPTTCKPTEAGTQMQGTKASRSLLVGNVV